MKALIGARIFDGERLHDDCALVLEGDWIAALTKVDDRPRGGEQVDLGGGILAPGFIDWQINGGGGVLFNAEPTVEGIAAIASAHRRAGVTGFLPTVVTDAPRVLTRALAAAREAQKRVPGALGVHVEGPFIDSRRKGVHPPEFIRPMQEKDAEALIEARAGAMVVTLAPASVPLELIARLAGAGIVVSLGHSDATAEEAESVFRAGASAVTHLYNAMSQLSSRAPGVVGAALADPRIVCGLIADGEHAHAAAYRVAIAAKGARGVALVSDAMPPAAGGPDVFELQGRRMTRVGRKLVAEDGTLAGAAITMRDAVDYVVRTLHIPLPEALMMATLTPARLLGVDDRIGRLKPGLRADLVHLTDDLQVAEVWAGGRAKVGGTPNGDVMTSRDPRVLMRSLFDAAVTAADPSLIVPEHLPEPPKGRTIVVGAGKAAAAMAAAVEKHWRGPLEGLVVTRVGHGAPTRRIRVVEAGHPNPDSAGMAAAAEILAMMRGLTSDDLVLALISGGGSALLSLPAGEVTLADKQAITRALLKSGARIDEMNAVRKHLSAIKGGRLAIAAAPAPVVTLIISDVPGDDLSVVASGPTVADATTLADARDVLARYKIDVPARVAAHLADPKNETPKPGDPRLGSVENRLVATPRGSLLAAAAKAREAGYAPLILGDAIEGEARECAIVHAGIALSAARHGEPIHPPCILLSGGETTVTIRGQGRGGRNSEFLLSLAIALDGRDGIFALAADTDGIDGGEDNAGAFVTPDTLMRARALGLDPRARLDDNDSYPVFAALGDLVVTGPTLTNVDDFRAILIEDMRRP